MNRLSPKIEIIKHSDNLINPIDINIEQSIKKHKENQMLGELNCLLFSSQNQKFKKPLRL